MEKLQRFLEKRPALRIHYESEGSFADYCDHFVSRVPPQGEGRLARLLLQKARQAGFDETSIAKLSQQLRQQPIASSADHAGLMHFGILYSSNLLFSGMMKQRDLPFQITMASARVPLGNGSFPRGFSFDNLKFSFFGDKKSGIPVGLIDENIGGSGYGNLVSYLTNGKSLSQLTYHKKKFLDFLLFDALSIHSPEFASLNLVEQFTWINTRLWKMFFAESTIPILPKMLYVGIDEIVNDLLVDYLREPGSLLCRILFEKDTTQLILDEFSGVYGCWTNYSGTHFFWHTGKRKTLHPLRINADRTGLVDPFHPDETFFHWNPEALSEAIQAKKLVPSIFTEMLLLAFVEGFTLLGGFNQVSYLAWMRVAHERCMLRLGDWPTAARFARTPTDGLICGPLPFPQWKSSLDMIWHYNSTNGVFNGNLEGGLSRSDLDAMMNTPMKKLIQNGVDAMLDVVE